MRTYNGYTNIKEIFQEKKNFEEHKIEQYKVIPLILGTF